jgi:hypothetical protein
MAKRPTILMIGALLTGTDARAQSAGDALRAILFRGELSGTVGAHTENSTSALYGLLLGETTTFPIGSSAGGFTWIFDSNLRVPVRRSMSFGSMFADIILSTSTEPQFFIDRPHESPFNVGLTLRLEDFQPDQVARLNALHPRPLAPGDVERLYKLVHGHPYLTRKALYIAAGSTPTCSVEELFISAKDDRGPFGDHLRDYLLRLQRKTDLIPAIRQVVDGRTLTDELAIYRLEALGLVRRDGHKVAPRCELYGGYFRERLRSDA